MRRAEEKLAVGKKLRPAARTERRENARNSDAPKHRSLRRYGTRIDPTSASAPSKTNITSVAGYRLPRSLNFRSRSAQQSSLRIA